MNVNRCEGPAGGDVSDSNSAGPAQFDTVTIGTGATVQYDDTHPAHGATAIKLATSDDATGAEVAWNVDDVTTLYGRMYFYAAAPVANHRVLTVIATGLAGLTAAMYWQTDRRIALVDAGGGNGVTSDQIPADQWVRLEFKIVQDAVAGVLELKVATDRDSPAMARYTATGQDTFGQPIGYVGFGSNWDAHANVGPFWLDDLGVATEGYLGPTINIADLTGADRPSAALATADAPSAALTGAAQ